VLPHSLIYRKSQIGTPLIVSHSLHSLANDFFLGVSLHYENVYREYGLVRVEEDADTDGNGQNEVD